MIAAAVERCAGIDVGKQVLAVTIMIGPLQGEPRVEQRSFGTNVGDLERLRDWLRAEEVTHGVMESTGSYWKPVYNVLEESVKVYLANGQEVKNRRGHKTDKKDGWWLAHLLRHAMIRPSFIPPRSVRELRDLTRRRKKILGHGTAEKNRVQKVLEDANVKLGNVLSDVFGASGQLMLEALLDGKKSVPEIAALAQRRARNRIPEIIRSLEGHQLSDHHRRLIRYSLDHMQFLHQQMDQLDAAIAEQIKKAGLEKDWELLQSLPGVQQTSAANILAEIGGDMKQFPSGGQLSSWAGVCPGNNESAGKQKHAHTNSGNPWLRSALTECAWAAAAKKDCFLKDEFWRIAAKHKGKKAPAVVAVAHTLLLLAYNALSTRQPFQDRSQPALSPVAKDRMIRHHVRRLGKLGVLVRHRVVAKRPKDEMTGKAAKPAGGA
jgi:transposase